MSEVTLYTTSQLHMQIGCAIQSQLLSLSYAEPEQILMQSVTHLPQTTFETVTFGSLQGYLAQRKPRGPRTLQQDYA
jgi:hypothetical protein